MPSWGKYLIVLAFAVGALIGLFIPRERPLNSEVADCDTQNWSNPLQPAYIGSDACAECHADQAAEYAQSGHAHTFHSENLAERFANLSLSPVLDPERKDSLSYQIDGTNLIAIWNDGQRNLKLPIQFALGSGSHATTFITLVDRENDEPTALEHRFSLFDHDQHPVLTPSHAGQPVNEPIDGFGRLHKGKDATTCVGCHSTTGSIRGDTVDDLRPNVRCESCHGPGRVHAAAIQANLEDHSMQFGKQSITAMAEIQMCGRCHRLPEMMSSPPTMSDPKLARFQPVGLLNSNCYRRSDGERLRCSTCHNPHQKIDRTPEAYTEKCRDCHTNPDNQQKVCPVSPLEKCVDCHMPPVEVHPGISFHDHWIRVRTPAE